MKKIRDHSKEPLSIGQKVHCILYGGRDGYITHIEGKQSPETCSTILGGIGVIGGAANIHIVFPTYFASVPESLVRGSVQWHVYPTIISADELRQEKIKTARYIADEKEKKIAINLAKHAECERQRTAPEYAHLKPCGGDATLIAKNIRADLKKHYPGTKFSVRKLGHNAIYVEWVDGASRSLVSEVLSDYKAIKSMNIDDSISYKTHAWVFGTIDYLSITQDFSDDAVSEAINKVNKRFNKTVSLSQYHSGNLPELYVNGNYNDFSHEIRRVLAAEVDYDLEDKRYNRSVAVRAVLESKYEFNYGCSKRNLPITVNFNDDAWTIDVNYCARDTVFDDYIVDPDGVASIINALYETQIYLYYKVKMEEVAKTAYHDQLITPLTATSTSKLIECVFPVCNKNDTLEQNDIMIINEFSKQKCKVVLHLILTDDQFNVVSGSLLNDRPGLWQQIGGTDCDDKFLADYEEGSQDYYEMYRVHGVTNVVGVSNFSGNDVFYVNTEGYDYARYVGRDASFIASEQAICA